MASTSDLGFDPTAPPNRDNPMPRRRIRKGQACNNCRQLKIKCDGVKPQCGPCTRYKRQHPCHYADERANPRALEDEIAALKEKIWNLERDDAVSLGHSNRSLLPDHHDQQSTHSGSPSYHPHTQPSALYSTLDFEQREQYLRTFVTAAPRITFLDSQRLIHRLSVRQDAGDPALPALLACAQLLGLHITPSQSGHYVPVEQMLLDEALKLTATSCLTPSSVEGTLDPPVGVVLDTIYSHILLSMYLLRVGRLAMANLSATSATSLVFSYDFYRRSNHSDEQKETAFWQVYTLDKIVFLVVQAITGRNSLPRMYEDAGVEVTIPWPGEQSVSRSRSNQDTIHQFLAGSVGTNLTRGSQYIKTLILYEHVVHLESRWNASLHEHLIPFFKTVDNIAESLRTTMGPATDPLVISLLYAVFIRAHRPFASDEHSRVKCMESAMSLIDLALRLYEGGNNSLDWFDVLNGLLWVDATSVFAEQTDQLRLRYNSELRDAPESPEEQRYKNLCARLADAIGRIDAPPTLRILLIQVRENCLRAIG